MMHWIIKIIKPKIKAVLVVILTAVLTEAQCVFCP